LTIAKGIGQPIPPVSSIVGGGVFASGGTLTITSCTLSDNHANFGAGIFANNENLTITDSLISDNTAPNPAASSGGGINFAATKALKLTIRNSTIDSNSAGDSAGIVMDNPNGTAAQPSGIISDSTISNNAATLEGGGVFAEDAKLTMTNTTVSDNLVSSNAGQGAGLLASTSKVTLNNVTIAGNSSAGFAGGVDIDINNKTFVFSNTIIADNSAVTSPDCFAVSRQPITSHDYNLVGDTSGCTIVGKTTHDLTGNPMLGPLQNNGGTTETNALLIGSPALGAGNPMTPNGTGGHCAPTDQIGTARSTGDCDVGAYQRPD
jgi:hypothetical protein